jgi:tetratricopeptide (TPR) repeat protein
MREFLLLGLWQSDKAKQCYLMAIENYNQALNIEPDHADALSNRASVYMSISRYDNAIDDYLKVLDINPQEQHALLGIAQAYEESGQIESAVLKYEEAVQFMENSEYWTQLHPDLIEKYRTKLEHLQATLP